eukprot:scaffold8421_cov114-Isochrysis_galbana.AAC.9
MIVGGVTGGVEIVVGVDDATKSCLPRGVFSPRIFPQAGQRILDLFFDQTVSASFRTQCLPN